MHNNIILYFNINSPTRKCKFTKEDLLKNAGKPVSIPIDFQQKNTMEVNGNQNCFLQNRRFAKTDKCHKRTVFR